MLPRHIALAVALCLLPQADAPTTPRVKQVIQTPPPAAPPRALDLPQEQIGAVSLSPDGRMLAFAEYDAEERAHIYVVPSDGGLPLQITSGGCNDISPRFSPDGQQVAFVSDRTGNADL